MPEISAKKDGVAGATVMLSGASCGYSAAFIFSQETPCRKP
jgi:hypothetical protein